jgi:uncharacterized integral membrane protein
MKKVVLILNIILIVILVMFSVQNASSVTVKFATWKIDVSLALLMILCVIAGAVITMIFNFVSTLTKANREKASKNIKKRDEENENEKRERVRE